jgi:glycosyl hydrolase family 12
MRVSVLAALTAAVAVPAVVLAASPGIAAAPPARTTTLCAQDAHMTVHNQWGERFTIRNDYWLGQRPQCLFNRDHTPSFQVVQQAGFDQRGRVVAFPDIFYGCAWEVCSPGSHLPAPVSTLRRPRMTWRTSERARGQYNAAFDIWFGRQKMTTGQADGAELMIWLNVHALPRCVGPKVWIGRTRYCVEHWVAHHRGSPVTWNYIQFRRMHFTTHVRRLRLLPFIRASERKGWIKRAWWLENIEAGFEIWRGGKGLATTRFWVRA